VFAVAQLNRTDQSLMKPFRAILILKDKIALWPGPRNGRLGFVFAFFRTLESDCCLVVSRDQASLAIFLNFRRL